MQHSQEYVTVNNGELIPSVCRLCQDGYRLVQISATKKEKLELIYSFDKNYELVNLRMDIGDDEEIQSISGIYPYAFLYENELKDLFGVNIVNINIDFKGHLYKTSIKTPFNADQE